MSVSKAIIIGSLIIASAIFFMRVSLFDLIPMVGTNTFLRFNHTTGTATVCIVEEAKLICNEHK